MKVSIDLTLGGMLNNMTSHGRAVHQDLVAVLEATDHHTTNHALAIERQLTERGYHLTPAPESDDGDGTPRDFIEYRAQGHGAQKALLDAINYADEMGDYPRMALWLIIMLGNYGYLISKGASSRCWKGWDEL